LYVEPAKDDDVVIGEVFCHRQWWRNLGILA